MPQLFDKRGGYRKLFTFTYATMIHLGTIRFCRRFISYKEDPLGKTTLMLHLATCLSPAKILYISGEESPNQIRERAQRMQLGVRPPQCTGCKPSAAWLRV